MPRVAVTGSKAGGPSPAVGVGGVIGGVGIGLVVSKECALLCLLNVEPPFAGGAAWLKLFLCVFVPAHCGGTIAVLAWRAGRRWRMIILSIASASTLANDVGLLHAVHVHEMIFAFATLVWHAL